MSRRFILKGDKTDHDGVVEEGVEGSSFQGRPLAFIGAKVNCPRCNTTGVIVPDGPRDMTVMGKTVALENDCCQCKCDPLPKLVASQTLGSISA
ncbi:PAAR domain-containing protein [Paraburkholderia phosphatilytica]|uniref:PAAR domain-containing protein n=1 Tax=Paraburkholderia phosphatilytica TaxID=2282883 RepID=UPI000E49FFBE|nr:PAAR domain-containing protein [Paraburkholderia phosphatilytica]